MGGLPLETVIFLKRKKFANALAYFGILRVNAHKVHTTKNIEVIIAV
jgi:hypothetical protein